MDSEMQEVSLILDLVVKCALVVIPIIAFSIWGIIKAKLKLNKGKQAKITAIIEQAVVEVYMEFVRVLKRGETGEQNNKLTIAQINEARRRAWLKAIEIAKREGINLANEIDENYFPVLIDKIIKSLKHGE
jgi:hypothetical protein